MDNVREELLHLLGRSLVEKAEGLSKDEFNQLKWEHLPDLLYAYEKVLHEPLLEARRSYMLGLESTLQMLLIRHILAGQSMKI